MRIVFALLGLLAVAAGLLTATAIRSDIQLQIVATCLIGGLNLLGVATILSRLSAR